MRKVKSEWYEVLKEREVDEVELWV